MYPNGQVRSHALTLSLKEKGNKRRWLASLEAPLIFMVSHTSKKIERYKLGSSMGVPPNCDCFTIEIRVDLNLKLLVVTSGLVMLGVMSWTPGVI